MAFWRLRWTLPRIFSPSFYQKLRKTLQHPAEFYRALAGTLFIHNKTKDYRLLCLDGTVIYINHFVSLFIFDEVFIDKFYDKNLNSKKPLIVDVGGNQGYFTLRFRQLYPQATLYTFEPDPTNFERLNRNVKESSPGNIHAFMMGMGQNTRTEKLFLHPTNLGGHSIVQESEDQPFEEIRIIGIEEAFETHQWKEVDLLKLDCEGAEYEIIMALTPNLAQKSKPLFMNPLQKITIQELPTSIWKNSVSIFQKEWAFIWQFDNLFAC